MDCGAWWSKGRVGDGGTRGGWGGWGGGARRLRDLTESVCSVEMHAACVWHVQKHVARMSRDGGTRLCQFLGATATDALNMSDFSWVRCRRQQLSRQQ